LAVGALVGAHAARVKYGPQIRAVVVEYDDGRN